MPVVAAHELRVVSPVTLEEVGAVSATAPSAVEELVAEASLAQEGWGATGPADRARLLGRLRSVVLRRASEIAETVCSETGKPQLEAYSSELYPALDALQWLERRSARALARERVRMAQPHLLHKRGWLRYEPVGVVGAITPWNFPFAIPMSQAAYALAAGNAVVLKPSELAPLSASLIADLLAEAGAPSGLLRVAQGGPEVGAALVAAHGVGKVVFTGSPDVGRDVAAQAGERLVPVTLELGGKDPMLVLDDADLERAVSGGLWASFLNCGQVCSGVERIYVEDGLYEPFAEELARRTRELRLGSDLGPLISERQRDRVHELVDEAVERGASLLAGGASPTARAGSTSRPSSRVSPSPRASRARRSSGRS